MSRPEYYGNTAGLTEDIDIVQAIFAAFAVRDIEGAMDFVAPNCEIYVEGTAREKAEQIGASASPSFPTFTLLPSFQDGRDVDVGRVNHKP